MACFAGSRTVSELPSLKVINGVKHGSLSLYSRLGFLLMFASLPSAINLSCLIYIISQRANQVSIGAVYQAMFIASLPSAI